MFVYQLSTANHLWCSSTVTIQDMCVSLNSSDSASLVLFAKLCATSFDAHCDGEELFLKSMVVITLCVPTHIHLIPPTFQKRHDSDAFEALCFHPSREQNSVCFDVTMECKFVALVRTQVKPLNFKRNQGVLVLQRCESTLYAYCCDFGVPCECSQRITTAGQLLCCSANTPCIR